MNGVLPFSQSQYRCCVDNYQIDFRLQELRRGEGFKGEMKDSHTLIFVQEGALRCSYNECTRYCFRGGEFFFIPQASYLFWEVLEDSRLLILTFDNDVDELMCGLKKIDSQLIMEDAKYDFGSLPIRPLLKSFVEVQALYLESGMQDREVHRLKQRELFLLLQHVYTSEELVRLLYPALGKGGFYSWVLQNYRPGVTLLELASRCHITPKSFSRKFHERFGVTFRDWMLEQKVNQIKLRLSLSEVSFKDIVREYNFYSLSHFSRFCKQNLGGSPSELKRQFKGKWVDK